MGFGIAGEKKNGDHLSIKKVAVDTINKLQPPSVPSTPLAGSSPQPNETEEAHPEEENAQKNVDGPAPLPVEPIKLDAFVPPVSPPAGSPSTASSPDEKKDFQGIIPSAKVATEMDPVNATLADTGPHNNGPPTPPAEATRRPSKPILRGPPTNPIAKGLLVLPEDDVSAPSGPPPLPERLRVDKRATGVSE